MESREVEIVKTPGRLSVTKFYKEQTGCGLGKAKETVWTAYEKDEPLIFKTDLPLEDLERISKYTQELNLKPIIREERLKQLLDKNKSDDEESGENKSRHSWWKWF